MAKTGKPTLARKLASRSSITEEQRNHYVEVAAYYIAERCGFHGDPSEHWTQAEQEVSRLLSEERLNH